MKIDLGPSQKAYQEGYADGLSEAEKRIQKLEALSVRLYSDNLTMIKRLEKLEAKQSLRTTSPQVRPEE